jgi:hypothetical protein
MFFLETKHLVDTLTLDHTLVVTKDGARIQRMVDDVTLCEWIVPIFHSTQEDEESFVDIDETFLKLLKKFSIFSLKGPKVFFEDLEYTFKTGEMVTWETRLPQLACILTVPHDLECYTEDTNAHVYTEEDHLVIEFKKLLKKKFKLFQNFQKNSEKVFIHFDFVLEILKDHKGKVCKVYIEKEFPMCLEFSGHDHLTTRYYIAPLYEDEC